ncbi:MAG: hypothetical protein ACOC56_06590 [Atribacterota bacterium]
MKKFLKVLIDLIFNLFEKNDSVNEVESLKNDIKNGKKELKARELLGAISEDAKDIIIDEALKFSSENYKVMLNLTPEQREYALNMSYLLAVKDLDTLSATELLEYRKLITKVAELGPDVSEQLHEFWEEFKNTANVIIDKVTDIGVKAAILALKTAIPALNIL